LRDYCHFINYSDWSQQSTAVAARNGRKPMLTFIGEFAREKIPILWTRSDENETPKMEAHDGLRSTYGRAKTGGIK
jgi:hypothetical protein